MDCRVLSLRNNVLVGVYEIFPVLNNEFDQELEQIIEELDRQLDRMDNENFRGLFGLMMIPLPNLITYQILPDTPPPTPSSSSNSLSEDEWEPSYSPPPS